MEISSIHKRILTALSTLVLVFAMIVLVVPFFSKENDSQIDEVYNKIPLVEIPQSGESVTSPIEIQGDAPSDWFFEGVFPVFILDERGLIIGEGFATRELLENEAEGMSRFVAMIEFDQSLTDTVGGVILLKQNNPSNISDRAHEHSVPILFEERLPQ